MKEKKPRLLVILGPTASGKSRLAMEIAGALDGEIVSSDSLQVYKHLDIGTAKPSPQERARAPHHLVDILEPGEEFNAGTFRRGASSVIESLAAAGKKIIVAGGTYLYVKALLSGLIEGLPADRGLRAALRKERAEHGPEYLYKRLSSVDPESASKIHPRDYIRTERALEVYELTGQKMSLLQSLHEFGVRDYDYLKIGINVERQELRQRIDERVDGMISAGLVDEVRRLRAMGYGPGLKPMQSIGYKEMNAYIDGEIGLERAVELIKRDTKRLAKRQMTWLRADKEIHWLDIPEDMGKVLEIAEVFFRGE
ncbi:MAG TPA: tRNA (adenosine(37)-N6)-dimethylallyltransferase MiaA [Thermodesulfobacteriota bacterium]|nr:tRNA (adenosine(37)-N6)-dimethylallyltransferase MiaA [Thermodesulfobacteriota bacterium]